jgi:hypothetical protein
MITHNRKSEIINKLIKRYGNGWSDVFSKLYDEARFDGYIEGIKDGKMQMIESSNDQRIMYVKHTSYINGYRDGKMLEENKS